MKSQKFYALASTATFALTNVLFYALLIRQLPTETMRAWVLFLVLISFVEMARQGMVSNGMVRLLASRTTANPEVLGAGLLLSLGSSIVGLGVAYGLSFFLKNLWDSPDLPMLCLWYLAVALPWAIYKWKESSLMADNRFDAVFKAAAVYGVSLFFAFFILKQHTSLTLPSMILIQALASAAAAGVLLFPKKNRATWAVPSRGLLNELIGFGRFNMGSNLLSMLFNKMDVLLIGALLPNASVVLYDAATRIYNWLDLPMNGIAAVIYPKLCRAFGNKGYSEASKTYAVGVLQLLTIGLPAVVITFLAAPSVLQVLAGASYVDASNILRVLVFATLIKPWGRLAGMALDAAGKPRANFYLLAFSATSNFILNLTLIHLLGLVGAAVATVFSVWATVGLGQWVVGKELDVPHIGILKGLPKSYMHILRKLTLKKQKAIIS